MDGLIHHRPTPIEEVIDGVNSADLPPAEKQAILQRIEREGGVRSRELRQDLIRIFDEQAEFERENNRVNGAMLRRIDEEGARGGTDGDVTQASLVVADVIAEQASVAKRFEDDVLVMRGDVMGLERQAANAEAEQRAASEREEIERLRQGLQGN